MLHEEQGMQQDQSTLTFRIEALEKMVQQLQNQLQQYVPAKENELQLRSIRETVERIEREVSSAKSQLTDLNTKLADSEVEAQKRDSALKENQNQMQIRVLAGIVSIFIAILLSIIGAYAAHVLH